MKNIDELYKKCYNAYKKDYKGENGLYKAKKKILIPNSLK